MAKITISDSDDFREAVSTLRKYRRAELLDENENSIIDDLYVDLFPNGRLLKEFLRENTAFLIGRRGTGKSTVFQKAQSDLQKSKNSISVYIDVAPVYQAAMLNFAPSADENGLNYETRYLWSTAFLRHFVDDLIEEISKKAGRSYFDQVFFMNPKRKLEDAQKDIRDLLEREEYLVEQDVSPMGATLKKRIDKSGSDERLSIKASIRNAIPGLKSKLERSDERSDEKETIGHQKVLKTFDFRKFVSALKEALKGLKIKHIYLFLDDYSELPIAAQEVLMDNVIHPLETASQEYIKLKIAAYPGHFYMGRLDPQKIDLHHLDVAAAYNSYDETQVTKRSSEYVKRIVERRIETFCKKPASHFFDGHLRDIYRLLFQASNCNPRALGYILDNCSISHISEGRPITEAAIREGAKRYYQEKIEAQLNAAKFSALDPEQLKLVTSARNLLSAIVDKAKSLKNNQGGKVLSQFSEAKLPTSHFHVSTECDDILAYLCHLQFLNFFKYLTNKDGKRVSVYSLTYGLCQKENILFGKPESGHNSGKYYIERCFNFSDTIKDVQNDVEIFKCDNCGAEHDISNESTFAVYNFKCPSCSAGTLQRTLLIGTDEAHEIDDKEGLLEPIELQVLQALFYASSKGNKIRAKDISEEVDLPPTTVGHVVKKLAEKHLVDRKEQSVGRTYRLTEKARTKFFSEALAQ